MTESHGVPMDDLDLEILDRLAAAFAVLDPPPAHLDERVLFAIDLDDFDVEVARLTEEELAGSGARATERTQTITFDAASRTVMITIVEGEGGDRVRIDGWLAPGAPLAVELRAPDPIPARFVTADETGRFVFDDVPRGLVQLVVHPAGRSGGPRVVTPSLVL
jgi:hypothetical protein